MKFFDDAFREFRLHGTLCRPTGYKTWETPIIWIYRLGVERALTTTYEIYSGLEVVE